MTDLRKRGPEGTLQARVFRLLQGASLTAAELSRLTGADREACRKACHYMGRRGLVVGHRIAPRLVLYAARIGAHCPRDRRGKQKGSRNHRGDPAWASWLRMMRKKHGPAWRPPQVRLLSSTAAMLLSL